VKVLLLGCLGGIPAAGRKELVKKCLRETGKTLAETGITWKWSLQRSAGLLEGVHNEHLFDKALGAAHGAGVRGAI
jgi:lauroyl/myristoyl acyltransferase